MMEKLTLYLVVFTAVQIAIELYKLIVNIIEAMKNRKKK